MDLATSIASINPFDLLAVFAVGAFFVAGFIQGTLRRLLGLAILLVSFLLATNIRDPLGAWLGRYWTQFPVEYSYMLAFGGSFLLLYLAGSIAVQTFYRRTQLIARSTLADELLGAFLGLLQAVLLIGAMITILDSFFAHAVVAESPNELGILRSIFTFYDPSLTARVYRELLIPGFLGLFAWITPASLRTLFVH